MREKILRICFITALILLVPLVAMQFSDEVDWSPADFVIIGALLVGTGLGFELTTKNVGSAKHRIAIGLVFLAILLLVWAELAVGVFGTPFAGS